MEKPTRQHVDEACEKFDQENKVIEGALHELFNRFPENTDISQVFLKAVALNALYSTRIPTYNDRVPTLGEVADHIKQLKIDTRLAAGETGLVYDIAKIEVPPKNVHFNYSFATKYCSWHQPSLYPIYDSRVDEYLWHFMQAGHIPKVERWKLKIYSTFKAKIIEFREVCGFDDLDFKATDKFLYLAGGQMLTSGSPKDIEAANLDGPLDVLPPPA